MLAGLAAQLRPDTLKAFPEQTPPGCPALWADYRLIPHYRTPSTLDTIISRTHPGHDAYVSEVYAEEVSEILAKWSAALREDPRNLGPMVDVLSPNVAATALRPFTERSLRNRSGLQIWRSEFVSAPSLGREAFVQELAAFGARASHLRTVAFEVAGLTIKQESPLVFATRIRYDLVGSTSGKDSDERTGSWNIEWGREANARLSIRDWRALEEIHSYAAAPIYQDITVWALGENPSFHEQMLRGTEYWRSVLDAACGIDVYGNNGVACGDIDNDGFDEIYVCQPAGLPNRLYRNRGDGRFDDITEAAGVGVLDATSSAIFADLQNLGNQDLIVVRTSGPLLFRNAGKGKFQLQPDVFRFAHSPQGSFTGTAVADYDRDGWLDVYFCLYSYYEGIDQYRYPTPYYDARNGPPNFMFRNNRDGTFSDVTESSGLNQNNDRFSFDCGWCDYNDDGWPDLYVVNDFGRKNLYRNNGNGTFTDVAEEAGVVDVGPGMSSTWFDYDNDGRQDLYVCDMWEPAGTRISTQPEFMKAAPESVRALYRRHAKGNSLYHNQGNGNFADRSATAGVEKAGWSWMCSAWDFDHDGYSDIYVATGMISGPQRYDLQGFFWRQVVSQSPPSATQSRPYEEGWNAINELIRSDGTWDGYQRNAFFANNGDGTFSHVAGAVGLDFTEDSRAFALADLDHDGSLELVLKNRLGPQLRVLRNVMQGRGNSISLRLRGHQSNRDAIGATVTVEAPGLRQVKFLHAGVGFFAQHTKELFFGLGQHQGAVRATVRWPNGLVQAFAGLPANHRIGLEEGSNEYSAEAFAAPAAIPPTALIEPKAEPAPDCFETWLLDPLPAPQFTLPGLDGRTYSLADFRGRTVLLHFWDTAASACTPALEQFQRRYSAWLENGLQMLAVHANAGSNAETVRELAQKKRLTFPILLASDDMLGVSNLLYRYLFDRRRNLGIPTSFLIDAIGQIVKVYQGPLDVAKLEEDLGRIPQTPEQRQIRALPFPGRYYGGEFHRFLFTYGVAFFRAGYYDEALAWFHQVVNKYPEYASAYYNLGTIYLNKGMLPQAEENLRRATELRPLDASAWNNLGMAVAQQGRPQAAIQYFQEAIRHNSQHVVALENLGKVYQDLGRFEDAQRVFERALSINPQSPEANYHLGMLFAQHNDADQAHVFLQRAIQLRPNYPDALNNLGVLNIREGNLRKAAVALSECIRVAPGFDVAYLNLAKVYVGMGKPEEARNTLQKLLQVHPGNPAALQALQQLAP